MRQQAEWRRLEQERTEAENRRIVEFASQRQQMEETKIEKIREREVAKENLYKTVEAPSSEQQSTRLPSQWQSSFAADWASQMTQLVSPFQLSRKLEEERQRREEMERVCEDLHVEEEEQAQRQREIVSEAVTRVDASKQCPPWIYSEFHVIDRTAVAVRRNWLSCQRVPSLPVFYTPRLANHMQPILIIQLHYNG